LYMHRRGCATTALHHRTTVSPPAHRLGAPNLPFSWPIFRSSSSTLSSSRLALPSMLCRARTCAPRIADNWLIGSSPSAPTCCCVEESWLTLSIIPVKFLDRSLSCVSSCWAKSYLIISPDQSKVIRKSNSRSFSFSVRSGLLGDGFRRVARYPLDFFLVFVQIPLQQVLLLF